jgi:PAS domain S-box-containing protein
VRGVFLFLRQLEDFSMTKKTGYEDVNKVFRELEKEAAKRKKAELAVENAREYAESIVATVREPLIVLNGDLRVVSANRSFYRIFAVKPEETEGQLVYDLGNRQWDIPRLRELLEEIIPKNNTFEGFQMEHDFPTIGRRIMVLNARRIYRDADKTQLILLAIEDVTDRVRAAQEREVLIEELEAKNEELERFTYTVSHDLKSPLITIRGFLGLLERDMDRGNAERVKADMRRIAAAADKMERLLRDLLELARIGRIVNTPEKVSFGDLAQEAVNTVGGRLKARGVKVEVGSALGMVYGDRTRLREAVENLVDNAVKFMGDQPEPLVQIGFRRDGDEPVFYVRDNGVGIDSQYHEKVFGLFNRLHNKTEGEGTGVGLAIVKRIVETHGGRIWIESKGTGLGSTFCFSLPEKSHSMGKETSRHGGRTSGHLAS